MPQPKDYEHTALTSHTFRVYTKLTSHCHTLSPIIKLWKNEAAQKKKKAVMRNYISSFNSPAYNLSKINSSPL